LNGSRGIELEVCACARLMPLSVLVAAVACYATAKAWRCGGELRRRNYCCRGEVSLSRVSCVQSAATPRGRELLADNALSRGRDATLLVKAEEFYDEISSTRIRAQPIKSARRVTENVGDRNQASAKPQRNLINMKSSPQQSLLNAFVELLVSHLSPSTN